MPAFVILTPPNFSADNFDVNDIGSNTVNLKSIVTKLNVERMKKNLAKNTNRLTSHYDINQVNDEYVCIGAKKTSFFSNQEFTDFCFMFGTYLFNCSNNDWNNENRIGVNRGYYPVPI